MRENAPRCEEPNHNASGFCAKVCFESEALRFTVYLRILVFSCIDLFPRQDLLGILMASNPSAGLYDLSQQAARAKGCKADAVNTIIPATTLWHKKRKRFVLGYELAQLQLIPVDEVDKKFPQKLLGDLAGNAFNGGSFLCVLIAVLTCLPPVVPNVDDKADVHALSETVAMINGL
jgi:hypothetical protein